MTAYRRWPFVAEARQDEVERAKRYVREQSGFHLRSLPVVKLSDALCPEPEPPQPPQFLVRKIA